MRRMRKFSYIYRTDWNLSYSLSVLFAAKWRAHSDGAVAIGREDIELLDVRDDKRGHAQHYGKHPDDHGREDSQGFCLVKREKEESYLTAYALLLSSSHSPAACAAD